MAGKDGTPVTSFKAEKKKSKISISEVWYEWYNVQNGDSLWTISKKFSASTADIKKWNNLKSNLIHPGSQLKLKKV
jgi:LysM repeat protein